MSLMYVAKIKETEERIETATQQELERMVIDRIANWDGVVADTTASSKCSLAIVALLIAGATLFFPPSTLVVVVLLITYHKLVDYSFNPFAHKQHAVRCSRSWRNELDRIQNLDSRLPYKKLPLQP